MRRQIIGSDGRILLEQRVIGSKEASVARIPLGDLAPGVYFGLLGSGEIFKFVKP